MSGDLDPKQPNKDIINLANKLSAQNNKARQSIYKQVLQSVTSGDFFEAHKDDGTDIKACQQEVINAILEGPCFRHAVGEKLQEELNTNIINQMALIANLDQLNLIATTVQANKDAFGSAFVEQILQNKIIPINTDEGYNGLVPEILESLAKYNPPVANDLNAHLKKIIIAANKFAIDESDITKTKVGNIFDQIVVNLKTEKDSLAVISDEDYPNVITKVGVKSLEKLASYITVPDRIDQLLEVVKDKVKGEKEQAKIVKTIFDTNKFLKLSELSKESLTTLAKYTDNTSHLKAIVTALTAKNIFPNKADQPYNDDQLNSIDSDILTKLAKNVTNLSQLTAIAKATPVDGNLFKTIIDEAEQLADQDNKKTHWWQFKSTKDNIKKEVKAEYLRIVANAVLENQKNRDGKLAVTAETLDKIAGRVTLLGIDVLQSVEVKEKQQDTVTDAAKKLNKMASSVGYNPIVIADTNISEAITSMLAEQDAKGNKKYYHTQTDNIITVFSDSSSSNQLMEIDHDKVKFPLDKTGDLSDQQVQLLFIDSLKALAKDAKEIVELEASGFSAKNAFKIVTALNKLSGEEVPLVKIDFKDNEDKPIKPTNVESFEKKVQQALEVKNPADPSSTSSLLKPN